MKPSEMKDLIERLVESWNAHDPDAVARCYAPDAVSRDITLTEPLHGRGGIRNAAAMYMKAFPDIRFDIRRIVWPLPSARRPARTGARGGLI